MSPTQHIGACKSEVRSFRQGVWKMEARETAVPRNVDRGYVRKDKGTR